MNLSKTTIDLNNDMTGKLTNCSRPQTPELALNEPLL